MKNHFLSILFLISACSVFSQTQNKTEGVQSNNLEFNVIAKLGFAKINETGNVPLNGFINGGDVLIAIRIHKRLNFSTGLGYFEFDGNRDLSGNTSSLKNSYLHIPVNLNSDVNLFKNEQGNQKIFLTAGLGFYGNSLLNQETETILNNSSEKNLGWNFGFSSHFGVKFILSDIFNLGIGYESQSDITKMQKNNIDRKIENSNTINFSMGLKI